MKVIIQGDGDLIGQACAAKQALADGPPARPDPWRVYTTEGYPRQQYVVRYNKASITVWPQPEAK